MRSELLIDFNAILKPKLVAHRFQKVVLKGCITDEELWRKDRLWFGASFDWRDRYFEAYLGHLYWFRDVMPRVVVVGDYSSYASFDPTTRFMKVGLAETLQAIRDSFNDALTKSEDHYSEVLRKQLDPTNGRRTKEYYAAMGEEVDDSALKQYLA